MRKMPKNSIIVKFQSPEFKEKFLKYPIEEKNVSFQTNEYSEEK